MFTIKQVFRTGHRDQVRLWEGKNVCLEESPPGAPTDMQVCFEMEGGVTCTIDSGIVFVMNGSGKTVETFRLRNSEMF